MRVLLVEDDRMIGAALEQALKDAAYAVDWATDAVMAASALDIDSYDLALLDLGLPFDQKKLTARSLDEVKPGGLGLHFIRDSMDVMEHSHKNGVNRLRLVKYFSADGKGQKPQGE